jgi:hypothetical protein
LALLQSSLKEVALSAAACPTHRNDCLLFSLPPVQAPAPQKLPVLYLLDSISKLVGEPYKTLFSPALPEVSRR